MSVYSTNFYNGLLSGGLQTIYTVPASNVVVIRDIEIFNTTSGTPVYYFQSSVSGSSATIWYVGAAPGTSWAQWHGRAVIPAGGSLLGYASGVNEIQALVSGYLLS